MDINAVLAVSILSSYGGRLERKIDFAQQQAARLIWAQQKPLRQPKSLAQCADRSCILTMGKRWRRLAAFAGGKT
jgi:hypothetical protein